MKAAVAPPEVLKGTIGVLCGVGAALRAEAVSAHVLDEDFRSCCAGAEIEIDVTVGGRGDFRVEGRRYRELRRHHQKHHAWNVQDADVELGIGGVACRDALEFRVAECPHELFRQGFGLGVL